VTYDEEEKFYNKVFGVISIDRRPGKEKAGIFL
jgi:hypothetical protein